MQRLGYWLGTFFFTIAAVAAGADWTGSFWRGGLTILGIVVIAIIGLIFSVCLVSWARKRGGGGGEYQRLVTYGIGRKESKERKNPWPKRHLH